MDQAYKKMSSHGSICIPAAMRRELGIEPRDPMVIGQENGEIRIRPYILRCCFCGTTEKVAVMNGKGICCGCAEAALERHGGGQDE